MRVDGVGLLEGVTHTWYYHGKLWRRKWLVTSMTGMLEFAGNDKNVPQTHYTCAWHVTENTVLLWVFADKCWKSHVRTYDLSPMIITKVWKEEVDQSSQFILVTLYGHDGHNIWCYAYIYWVYHNPVLISNENDMKLTWLSAEAPWMPQNPAAVGSWCLYNWFGTLIKISCTVNGCAGDGLVPPGLTTIIVVIMTR